MIAQRPKPLERVDTKWLTGALERNLPQGAKRNVALDEARGVLREIGAAGLGQLLHALRQTDGVPLRGVVHPQIVSDPADHNLARVQPHAGCEARRMGTPHFVRIGAERVAQMEHGEAGPSRVVFVRDRRAEECHDTVARVLVHGPLEAVHALGEDLEEAFENSMPFLRIELLGQVHRALHVGE
jgi:hypothetical protein